ncbi:Xylooligosaccharide oxidase [Pseudolycoriella hygida]|uniref:Xylooligosaccharide oxidase n=1 Tax=Pseudolycoriella hygida TaxID=35572 RepID=A0A9Q0N0K4_9DIPT|nr:Xylooligosaccharide oxidase [Pseudolycoriella hygida]
MRSFSKEYEELNFQWNTLNGYLTPLVYLVATSASDIRKAVICSRLTRVRIVPRAGGHSYTKSGFGDNRTLIVDLASLNEISVDSNQMTCEIGPGTRNGMITYKLWERNFLVAQGVCPSVGISGLTLGGGYGHFSRLFGLSLDSVIEMEMIDAKGRLLVANNSTNKDLFWALRGGGGGNFGIVTKFKFKMHRAPKSIVYGQYYFSFNDFIQFFTAWQSLIRSGLPNNVFGFSEIEGSVIKFGLYTFNGPNIEKLQDVSIDDIENLLTTYSFPTPTEASTERMNYTEFMLYEAQMYSDETLNHPSQLATLTRHNHVGWKKVKSIYVEKFLNKRSVAKLYDLMKDYLKSASWLMEIYGGAVDSLSPWSTAFVHRGNHPYLIQLRPLSSQGNVPIALTDVAMETFFTASKAVFDHKESYQNYLDQDMDDYLVRYYGSNLDRLKDVKTMIDPDNVFHYPQSIPVKKIRN